MLVRHRTCFVSIVVEPKICALRPESRHMNNYFYTDLVSLEDLRPAVKEKGVLWQLTEGKVNYFSRKILQNFSFFCCLLWNAQYNNRFSLVGSDVRGISLTEDLALEIGCFLQWWYFMWEHCCLSGCFNSNFDTLTFIRPSDDPKVSGRERYIRHSN